MVQNVGGGGGRLSIVYEECKMFSKMKNNIYHLQSFSAKTIVFFFLRLF